MIYKILWNSLTKYVISLEAIVSSNVKIERVEEHKSWHPIKERHGTNKRDENPLINSKNQLYQNEKAFH